MKAILSIIFLVVFSGMGVALGYLVGHPLAKWLQGGKKGRPDIGMFNDGKPR